MADADQTGNLPRARCLELVGSHSLGRVALSHRALPTVVPVAYRLVDNRLVFVSAPDHPIVLARPRLVVAFQVDEIDPATFAGWSVVVVGVVEEIAAAQLGWGVDRATPQPFQQTPSVLAGLTTDHVSGRQFLPAIP